MSILCKLHTSVLAAALILSVGQNVNAEATNSGIFQELKKQVIQALPSEFLQDIKRQFVDEIKKELVAEMKREFIRENTADYAGSCDLSKPADIEQS